MNGSVRIIAGKGKGRRLQTPAGRAIASLRAARVRQTLFDILAPRHRRLPLPRRLRGRRRRSGSRRSRAAPRGSCSSRRSAAAIAALRENASCLRPAAARSRCCGRTRAIALPALAERGRRFDVVYLDPPYASELYEPLIEAVAQRRTARATTASLVAEHFKKRPLPETIGRLSRTRGVRVGDHALGFYAWARGEERFLSSRKGTAIFPGSFDPDHERPPGHHRARPQGVRPRDHRDPGERREALAVHHRGARGDHPRRPIKGSPRVQRRQLLRACSSTTRSASARRDRARAARDLRLRVRVPDGAHEPAPERRTSRPSS